MNSDTLYHFIFDYFLINVYVTLNWKQVLLTFITAWNKYGRTIDISFKYQLHFHQQNYRHKSLIYHFDSKFVNVLIWIISKLTQFPLETSYDTKTTKILENRENHTIHFSHTVYTKEKCNFLSIASKAHLAMTRQSRFVAFAYRTMKVNVHKFPRDASFLCELSFVYIRTHCLISVDFLGFVV